MNEKKFYKMIAFDLDTKKLKLIYKKGHYTNAYYELAQFFKNHHFTEHNQGSCYVSNIEMTRVNHPPAKASGLLASSIDN